MQNNVQILDCTLRDGGYVNNWDFGHAAITGIYKRLDEANVDYIEIGYLRDKEIYNENSTVFPSTQAINQTMSGVTKKNSMPVAMIDFGDCGLDSLSDASESFVEGIRLTFKKAATDEALKFGQQIKAKGYKLFLQVLSITTYTDRELLDFVERVNEIRPFAISMVDTYGLLDDRTLTRYFSIIDNNLDVNIGLGYHDHNNFQLGFSNTAKFMAMKTGRVLVGDASVYGMGKSAGNTPSELLCMHMNTYYEKTYDLSRLLEIVNTYLMPIYQKSYWGYKYDFYISAMQNCHPNYVKYLLDKNTLSVKSVNDILAKIPEEKKLSYDKEYIVRAYIEFQDQHVKDDAAYSELANAGFGESEIVILGPGSSVVRNTERIQSEITTRQAKVISVNFCPKNFDVDYVFISNAKRYSLFEDSLSGQQIKPRVIATSNIAPTDVIPNYSLNYEALLNENEYCRDNALLLLLKMLQRLNCKCVYLAGMDGYRVDADNYYSSDYECLSNVKVNEERNRQTSLALTEFAKNMTINFITETTYII